MGASGRGGTSYLFSEPNVGGLPRRPLVGNLSNRSNRVAPYRGYAQALLLVWRRSSPSAMMPMMHTHTT
jgi:hypothetical protein